MQAYISGALTNAPNNDELQAFYEGLADVVRAAGYAPYVPHLHSDPVKHAHLTPAAVVGLDRRQVWCSALVLAYVGVPSFGVGAELVWAEQVGARIILLHEHDRPVSRLVRGLAGIDAVVTFTTFGDALTQVGALLRAGRA